jgi:serine/threonine protein kinase
VARHAGEWLGHLVAIKSLTPGSMNAETFLAEATVMKRLRHHGVLALYAVCLDAEPFYIVTEFMVNGDLLGYLKRSVTCLRV